MKSLKTITLVAYNRLRYLAKTLESLRENALDGYTLFIGVEPADEDVADYCRGIDWIPTRVAVNRERYGVAWNPFHTINRAMEAGSTFNIALEDDLFLSPDALQLADWYNQRYAREHLCLCFCNYSSVTYDCESVFRAKSFVPLGYCFSREAWLTALAPNWMSDKRGWDFSVQALFDEASTYLLVPGLSRATHIGREEGSHCTIQYHDRVFKELPVSRGGRVDFRLDTSNGGFMYDSLDGGESLMTF